MAEGEPKKITSEDIKKVTETIITKMKGDADSGKIKISGGFVEYKDTQGKKIKESIEGYKKKEISKGMMEQLRTDPKNVDQNSKNTIYKDVNSAWGSLQFYHTSPSMKEEQVVAEKPKTPEAQLKEAKVGEERNIKETFKKGQIIKTCDELQEKARGVLADAFEEAGQKDIANKIRNAKPGKELYETFQEAYKADRELFVSIARKYNFDYLITAIAADKSYEDAAKGYPDFVKQQQEQMKQIAEEKGKEVLERTTKAGEKEGASEEQKKDAEKAKEILEDERKSKEFYEEIRKKNEELISRILSEIDELQKKVLIEELEGKITEIFKGFSL